MSDITAIQSALEAIEHDARRLVDGLTDEQGGRQPEPGSWSVAECLDHLAVGNEIYMTAMRDPAAAARAAGRRSRGPATPGLLGGWFAWSLEPPVKKRFRTKAPAKIAPRQAPRLSDAAPRFFASHDAIRRFVRENADLDLAGVLFPNPFVPVLRFSLASGIHILAAHERRHIWQAWNVRRATGVVKS